MRITVRVLTLSHKFHSTSYDTYTPEDRLEPTRNPHSQLPTYLIVFFFFLIFASYF